MGISAIKHNFFLKKKIILIIFSKKLLLNQTLYRNLLLKKYHFFSINQTIFIIFQEIHIGTYLLKNLTSCKKLLTINQMTP